MYLNFIFKTLASCTSAVGLVVGNITPSKIKTRDIFQVSP